MSNSYSISRCTWKWTKKILSPSGPFNSEQFYSPHLFSFKMMSLKFFRLALVRDLIRGDGGAMTLALRRKMSLVPHVFCKKTNKLGENSNAQIAMRLLC
jgi:hypothetical protein